MHGKSGVVLQQPARHTAAKTHGRTTIPGDHKFGRPHRKHETCLEPPEEFTVPTVWDCVGCLIDAGPNFSDSQSSRTGGCASANSATNVANFVTCSCWQGVREICHITSRVRSKTHIQSCERTDKHYYTESLGTARAYSGPHVWGAVCLARATQPGQRLSRTMLCLVQCTKKWLLGIDRPATQHAQ